MQLTGLPFLALLILVAAGLVGATAFAWNRWPRAWAAPMRILALLLVMSSGALLAADWANRVYGFYPTFGELFGGPPAARAATDVGARLPPGVEISGPLAAAHGAGLVIPWRLPAGRAGSARDGLVYLPSAYFDRRRPDLRFPVIELLHGSPGTPENWIKQMHVDRALDSEIAAGRIPPVIAVMPRYTTRPGQSCVDLPRGVQDATYLGVDVPEDVGGAFRALTTPRSWGTLGFSTGGFCAVDTALRDPMRYAAAASMSGYFTAAAPRVSAGPPAWRRALQRADSPIWQVTGDNGRRVALYVVASGGDPPSVAEAKGLRRAAGPAADLTTVILPTGGHNYRVWTEAAAPALDWLAAHLPPPLTLPLHDSGARVEGPSGPARSG